MFSNLFRITNLKVYDIVIVGGGISGVFLAYKLLATDLKVILFDGDKNLGGRIDTYSKDGSSFEAGMCFSEDIPQCRSYNNGH